MTLLLLLTGSGASSVKGYASASDVAARGALASDVAARGSTASDAAASGSKASDA